MQKNSFKIFCLNNKKFRCGTLRCLRKFWLSKNFMHKKGISLFSLEFFCLTVPKNFVGEPFCVSKNFWYGKKLWLKRGGYHDFPSNICLTVPKKFVGEPFGVSEKLGYRKTLCIKGGEGITILRWKILDLILPKKFVGDPSLFHKISGIEKLLA